MHSINVQAVTCSRDGTQASIFGTATVNGGGSFDYRIDLKDLGEPGSSDTYRIRLSNGYDSGVKVLSRRKRPAPLVALDGQSERLPLAPRARVQARVSAGEPQLVQRPRSP